METLVELEAELAKAEGEISDAYWRFTRTASSKVGPPPAHLYVKRKELKRRIRELKETIIDDRNLDSEGRSLVAPSFFAVIRFAKPNTEVDGATLVGKYVMRLGHKLWRSCSAPRVVLAATKKKLNVGFVGGLGMHPTARGGKPGWCIDYNRPAPDESPPHDMMVTSVYAICDTLDDVVALMNHELDCQDAFDAMTRAAAAALAALDGTTPPPAHMRPPSIKAV